MTDSRLIQARTGLRDPRVRPALVGAGVALLGGAVWLLGPRTGTDLAAQIARADFARHHALTPIDLRWFSGTPVFGYSVWTPAVMAWAGVRITGLVCAVLASAQTAELFRRTGARRPAVGGALAAVLQLLNLVAGRVTFAAGMVCGLAVLLVLARPGRWVVRTAVGSLLCATASPVAALMLCVCGGALVLRGRLLRGGLPIVCCLLPLLTIAALFGSGGDETFSGYDCRNALLSTTAVLLFAPLRPVLIRLGAGVAFVMTLLAYLLDTPVGNNAVRLSLLFAVPVTAAYTRWRPWLAVLAVVAAALPQQIVQKNTVSYSAGRNPGYYAPLAHELAARGPLLGRLEIPETRAHWDDAYLARSALLARGWLRQTDLERNGSVFFTGRPIPATTYRRWLAANSVEYVAVPDTPLTHVGQRERAVVLATSDYLRLIWHSAHWQLYAVEGFTPVVRTPGRGTRLSPTTVSLVAPARARLIVQVQWSRWLTLTGPAGCISRASDGNMVLSASAGGTYRIGSGLLGPHRNC